MPSTSASASNPAAAQQPRLSSMPSQPGQPAVFVAKAGLGAQGRADLPGRPRATPRVIAGEQIGNKLSATRFSTSQNCGVSSHGPGIGVRVVVVADRRGGVANRHDWGNANSAKRKGCVPHPAPGCDAPPAKPSADSALERRASLRRP